MVCASPLFVPEYFRNDVLPPKISYLTLGYKLNDGTGKSRKNIFSVKDSYFSAPTVVLLVRKK